MNKTASTASPFPNPFDARTGKVADDPLYKLALAIAIPAAKNGSTVPQLLLAPIYNVLCDYRDHGPFIFLENGPIDPSCSQKVRWVSDYYPLGHWEDENGNRVTLTRSTFTGLVDGVVVHVMLRSVTEPGTHGEKEITANVPVFTNTQTGLPMEFKNNDYLELRNARALLETKKTEEDDLQYVGDILPGRGIHKVE